MKTAIALMEAGIVPDSLIRQGIRQLLRDRLRTLPQGCEEQSAAETAFLDELRRSPIALHTQTANEQHYELPPDFFRLALGKHRKYSANYWPEGVETLTQSEEAMLALTCQRAELADGMRILELGCGWGAITLWMASHYPQSEIVAVSNSKPQREYIESMCELQGLSNVRVLTADMNDFDAVEAGAGDGFDRVVSVEMFEHMRNYELLMERISRWLLPEGKLFVHIFCHKDKAYPFEIQDSSDWMAKYFFTGGIMPSHQLLLHFQKHLDIEETWRMNGEHYSRTAEAWLQNMDQNGEAVDRIFQQTYGKDKKRWIVRWRTFFLAVAELFRFRRGEEWLVGHYRFVNRRSPATSQGS